MNNLRERIAELCYKMIFFEFEPPKGMHYQYIEFRYLKNSDKNYYREKADQFIQAFNEYNQSMIKELKEIKPEGDIEYGKV